MAVVTRQQRRPFHVVLYMRQRPGRGPAKRTRPAIPQIRDSADTCAWNASGSYWAYPIWDRAATRSNLTGVRPTRWRDWSQAGHQLAPSGECCCLARRGQGQVRTGGAPPGPANLAARYPWCWMAQVHAGGSWLPRGGDAGVMDGTRTEGFAQVSVPDGYGRFMLG